MSEIQGALLMLALTVITGVGALAGLYVQLAKARLKNQIKAEEDRYQAEKDKATIDTDSGLYQAINSRAYTATKSAYQTKISGKRDSNGKLPAPIAQEVKQFAIEETKRLMGPRQVEIAKGKYGSEEVVNAVIGQVVEAAVHDIKDTKTSTVQSTSVTTTTPDGSTIQKTAQAITSMTEPQGSST